jgi:hypothetical protein
MKKTIIILTLLIQAFLFSCKKDGACHLSNGSIITEEKEAGIIDSILVFNDIDVIISKGPKYAISVEAPENLLPFIICNLEGRKLILSNINQCNFIRKRPIIKVFVTVPALATIQQFGTGIIKSNGPIKSAYFSIYNYAMGDTDIAVETDFIYVHSRGGGDVTLTGQTKTFKILSSGTGFIHASDFNAKDVELVTNSTGDISISAAESLKIRLEGAGNIFYKGNPAIIDTLINGNGQIYLLK